MVQELPLIQDDFKCHTKAETCPSSSACERHRPSRVREGRLVRHQSSNINHLRRLNLNPSAGPLRPVALTASQCVFAVRRRVVTRIPSGEVHQVPSEFLYWLFSAEPNTNRIYSVAVIIRVFHTRDGGSTLPGFTFCFAVWPLVPFCIIYKSVSSLFWTVSGLCNIFGGRILLNMLVPPTSTLRFTLRIAIQCSLQACRKAASSGNSQPNGTGIHISVSASRQLSPRPPTLVLQLISGGVLASNNEAGSTTTI